ncbi:ATP-binding protein [Haloplanus pelagicus]|uniref:ATP-binding protein n=1 Tax=Haloplanus pelagicus TaxID=2949995 RepID=UPI00203BED79|nr:ATP-binding protein [Haloplanus sp. HW8-1]
MIRVLYVAADEADAEGDAAALERAAPSLSVVPVTPSGALDALGETSVDCLVIGLDPADEGVATLLGSVHERGPDLPLIVAGAAVPERLAARIAAAVPDDEGATDRDVASVPVAPQGSCLDAIPGIACIVDADGTVRRWNERTAALVGGRDSTPTLTELVSPPARERLAAALDEALDVGRGTTEEPVETAAGRHVAHEWTLTRIGDGSARRGCRAVAVDVSERAAIAAELRATESSLAALYDILSDREATFESRLDRILELGCDRLGVEYGFLTHISGETQRIVDARGSHPLLQPDEQCPLSEAYCRKAIRSDGLLGVQDAIDEGWKADPAYEAFGLGCYLGGKVIVEADLYGTLCFADDDARERAFTDAERTFVELLTRWVSYELEGRAATEELRRRNERLSEFASIVSHDLRNPLNVAKGKLQVSRETGEMDHLDHVDEALDRMEDLVTGLLDLAEQGTVIEAVGDVELADVVAAAWANVETEGADLVVDADGTISADRNRLLQSFENLFRNAIEHGAAADGGVADLTVRVGDLPDGFYVEDTGKGIDPERRDSVFERGRTSGGGTGLGLTIVRAVADAHGWTIDVTEADAGGARFEFSGVDRPVPTA